MNKKILICDDHYDFFETLRFFMNEYFEADKPAVEFSSNGTDALLNTSKKKYDLIISDFQMPGINGIEFINSLRTNNGPVNKQTPVLMFSAFEPNLSELVGGEESITFMSKPFNSEKLMEFITRQFNI